MAAMARPFSKINPARTYPARTYPAIAQHGKTADNPGNGEF